ncbi:MAG: aspartate aminotransferase family protein [Balneolales bacterium]
MDSKESFFSHIAQTSHAPMALEISHARGPYLYTTDGRRFVDFISGIAVSSLGHSHPAVIKAVTEQIGKHMHVMVYGEFIQKPQSDLAGLITAHLPDSLDRIYFSNSGTEANEGALKLAKKFTGRTRFLAFENSYHGDTCGSLSVTGRDVYRDPYKPLLPGVDFAGFNDTAALEHITGETAAVILEPIQGEGGIIAAEPHWLMAVRKRCDETGTLLIFDEIQSGFGRTGTLFVFEQYGVVPDILTMAKAMGGGMPLGGFASSSGIFEVFKNDPPLNHVTTFGGHPVSCAAALASLRVLLEDNLMERALHIGHSVKEQLKHPLVTEIRGKGGMLGLQLQSMEQARNLVENCLHKGIVLGWTLHSDTLIRLAPPLIIDDDLLNETLLTIQQALSH